MNPLSRTLTLLFIFLFSALLPVTVNAHKLRIFAWPEGDIIHGQTAFGGNRKPKNVEIIVQDAASHAPLLTTRTDKLGEFYFQLPEKAVQEQLDLLLVVNSGDGHRGEWSMPAAEYLTRTSHPLTKEHHKSTSAVTAPSPSTPTARTNPNHIDEQMLRRIVGEELEKKLAPLKYMLAKSSDNSPDLRDILGGIGYILGLAGILAWLKAKKQKKSCNDDL